MTFEEWLKTVWLEDENRAIRRRQINELREEVKSKIIEIFEGDTTGFSGCMCDSCIASIIKADDVKGEPPKWLTNSLVVVALEYLLGENFNGAAANYYYDYVKRHRNNNMNHNG